VELEVKQAEKTYFKMNIKDKAKLLEERAAVGYNSCHGHRPKRLVAGFVLQFQEKKDNTSDKDRQARVRKEERSGELYKAK